MGPSMEYVERSVGGDSVVARLRSDSLSEPETSEESSVGTEEEDARGAR